jgi:hypothetical protein
MNVRMILPAVRVFLAGITLSAIAAQFAHASARGFSPVNFFSFFTVESNLFIAVVFLAIALVPSWRVPSVARDLVRGAAALYMVTTGVVYMLLLSGLEEALQTQIPWVNVVLHYIMPVVAFLDWAADPPEHGITFRRALIWLAYPFLYLVYSLSRGPLAGWYPYPFLDPARAGGYAGVALYAAAITVTTLILIGLLVWIGRRRVGRPSARPSASFHPS